MIDQQTRHFKQSRRFHETSPAVTRYVITPDIFVEVEEWLTVSLRVAEGSDELAANMHPTVLEMFRTTIERNRKLTVKDFSTIKNSNRRGPRRKKGGQS